MFEKGKPSKTNQFKHLDIYKSINYSMNGTYKLVWNLHKNQLLFTSN